MLIFDIYGVKEKGSFKFKMPYYKFEWNQHVALSRLVVEWSSKDKMFAFVKSDLVDLSSTNNKQQLFSFAKVERTVVTDIYVPYPVFYEIQLHQLEDASISIEPMFNEPLPEIKNVYLQLLVK